MDDGAGNTLSPCEGFARVLSILMALLVFVAPANATMRDIALEHLPQPFAQLLDTSDSGKPVLRAEKNAFTAALAAGSDPHEGRSFLAAVAARPVHPAFEPAAWSRAAEPCLAIQTARSDPQRAPPAT